MKCHICGEETSQGKYNWAIDIWIPLCSRDCDHSYDPYGDE